MNHHGLFGSLEHLQSASLQCLFSISLDMIFGSVTHTSACVELLRIKESATPAVVTPRACLGKWCLLVRHTLPCQLADDGRSNNDIH